MILPGSTEYNRFCSHIHCASSHDSFNASPLGAYVESPLGARGELSGSTYMVIEARVDTVDVITTVNLDEHDDTTGHFGSPPNTTYSCKGYSGSTLLFDLQNHASESFNAGTTYSAPVSIADIPAPDGSTRHVFNSDTGTSASGVDIDITKLEISNIATGEVVRSYSGFRQWLIESDGADATPQNYYIEPYCYHGPYFSDQACALTGENGSLAVRWRRAQSGPNWAVFAEFATYAAYVSGFSPGTCVEFSASNNFRFEFNGSEEVNNLATSGFGAAGHFVAAPLCGGGSYGVKDITLSEADRPARGTGCLFFLDFEPLTVTGIESLDGADNTFSSVSAPFYELVNSAEHYA